MELDIVLTNTGFTYVSIFSLLALAANFNYSFFKKKEGLMELAAATLTATIFILCMWAALVGLDS